MKKATTALSLAVFAYAGNLSAAVPTTSVDKFECFFETMVLVAELEYPLESSGTKIYSSIEVSGNFPSEPAEEFVTGGGTPAVDVYISETGTTFTVERDLTAVMAGEANPAIVRYSLQHGGGHGLSPEFECRPTLVN